MVSVSLTSKMIMTQHGDMAFYVIYTLLGCEGTFLCVFDLSAKPHLQGQDEHALSHPFSQVSTAMLAGLFFFFVCVCVCVCVYRWL